VWGTLPGRQVVLTFSTQNPLKDGEAEKL